MSTELQRKAYNEGYELGKRHYQDILNEGEEIVCQYNSDDEVELAEAWADGFDDAIEDCSYN